ncbi:hypothetical protein PR048_018871 [Dryococelus australis]|uniref:Reverse transcriptase domain-containing protein n=1 Tax=Dryococelus australis TaxID=614101 RepID=A0ABQ9H1V5_9NEOP|nr:hypothetical protein PR048_018871 [Dryococelus australis]
MRVNEASMQLRWNERENERTPRTPANQRHSPARFPYGKIRGDPAGNRTLLALVTLHQATIFTSWDLKCGYRQVPVKLQDRETTVLTATDERWFQFCAMPFGLKCAPATFQSMLVRILDGLIWEYTLAYLDDVIAWSSSWEEQVAHLSVVLERLAINGLTCATNKCHVGETSQGTSTGEWSVTRNARSADITRQVPSLLTHVLPVEGNVLVPRPSFSSSPSSCASLSVYLPPRVLVLWQAGPGCKDLPPDPHLQAGDTVLRVEKGCCSIRDRQTARLLPGFQRLSPRTTRYRGLNDVATSYRARREPLPPVDRAATLTISAVEFYGMKTAVVEWPSYSLPTWMNLVRFLAGSLPYVRMWESCRTTPLVYGFHRESPISSAFAFRRFSIPRYSFTLICSPDLDVKIRTNLFTHFHDMSGYRGSTTMSPVFPFEYYTSCCTLTRQQDQQDCIDDSLFVCDAKIDMN